MMTVKIEYNGSDEYIIGAPDDPFMILKNSSEVCNIVNNITKGYPINEEILPQEKGKSIHIALME